jgi:hypothetical protein
VAEAEAREGEQQRNPSKNTRAVIVAAPSPEDSEMSGVRVVMTLKVQVVASDGSVLADRDATATNDLNPALAWGEAEAERWAGSAMRALAWALPERVMGEVIALGVRRARADA